MKPEKIIQQLDANAEVFRALLSHKDEACRRYKPDEVAWSLLEIVCHLFDEEREDFRVRVFHALQNPDHMPPAIDPVGWVTSRKYMEQDYDHRLSAFLEERKTSIRELIALSDPSWDHGFDHPQAGRLTAYTMLANWLAHDYHHIRQINRRLYEYLREKSEVGLGYAGDW